MKKTFIITILSLVVSSSFGQQFTDLYGDYLGQTPPGKKAVMFAPGIISKNSLEHSATIFSGNGNKVYWCSIEFPYLFFTRWTENNHQDIFWVNAKIIDRLREKSTHK
jgi:hypothetical protein